MNEWVYKWITGSEVAIHVNGDTSSQLEGLNFDTHRIETLESIAKKLHSWLYFQNDPACQIGDSPFKGYFWGKWVHEISNDQYLIKTYCLPTLMYAREVWSLTNSSLHIINVMSCGIIVSAEFLIAVGEKAHSPFSITVIFAYIDQRQLMFWENFVFLITLC